jgi:hypothetical protein
MMLRRAQQREKEEEEAAAKGEGESAAGGEGSSSGGAAGEGEPAEKKPKKPRLVLRKYTLWNFMLDKNFAICNSRNIFQNAVRVAISSMQSLINRRLKKCNINFRAGGVICENFLLVKISMYTIIIRLVSVSQKRHYSV